MALRYCVRNFGVCQENEKDTHPWHLDTVSCRNVGMCQLNDMLATQKKGTGTKTSALHILLTGTDIST